MSRHPLVSVFMPSYNHEKFIRASIESVLNQTLADLELIIVDDGSTDRTWDVINEYIGLDSRIVAVRQSNQGPSVATNYAISLAKGKYIAAITSDDVFLPTKLEKQVKYLEKNQNVDIVGTFIEEITSSTLIEPPGQYQEWFNRIIPINEPDCWIWSNCLASPTVFFRNNFFENYGLYEEGLIYTQDWEMWIRALSKGCKIHVIPEPLMQYRVHDNNLTHQQPLKTYLEYSYISSKHLHPWLTTINRFDLIMKNIMFFLNDDRYLELNLYQKEFFLRHFFQYYELSYDDYKTSLESEKKHIQ